MNVLNVHYLKSVGDLPGMPQKVFSAVSFTVTHHRELCVKSIPSKCSLICMNLKRLQTDERRYTNLLHHQICSHEQISTRYVPKLIEAVPATRKRQDTLYTEFINKAIWKAILSTQASKIIFLFYSLALPQIELPNIFVFYLLKNVGYGRRLKKHIYYLLL